MSTNAELPFGASPSVSHAPSAFGGDLRRFASLTWILAVTDFKLRFFGSALGYLWSLMKPLMLFGVLYLVFTNVFNLGTEVDYYPVYLLTGIVLWSFFAEVTSGCVTCLVARENLLRKIRFPRMVIPLSVVLTALFNLGLNLVAVAVFIVISGVPVMATWLLMPLLVLLLIVLAVGVGTMLSALYVRYRDIQPIWDVCLQVLFYGTPILYVATKLPQNIQREAMANPIAVVTTQMRHWLLQPSAPTAGEVIGATWRLILPIGIVIGLFALGIWIFSREAPRIAEHL